MRRVKTRKVTRERSCEGKVRHADRSSARHAARSLRQEGAAVHAYHCGFCGFWHVGHKHPQERLGR